MLTCFYLLLAISVLVGVSFFTLLEQKALSNFQIRKGPNKVGMVGLIQPFSDAIKLFTKESMNPQRSNYFSFFLSPVVALSVSLFIWLSIPYSYFIFNFSLSTMFLISCMSVSVYSIIFSGWSSNSKYALIGSLRAIAQTISYEICLVFILLGYLILLTSLNLAYFCYFQEYVLFFMINIPLSMVIFVIFLAETNRAPFDFAEGESELVSGFNVEYSSGGFAVIFLAEYSSILFMSVLMSFMLFNLYETHSILFFMISMLVAFMFIWVRASFPRYRYDKLMSLTWLIYLPISLFLIIVSVICMVTVSM